MLARIFRESRGIEISTPFPRMTYREAMDRFGSDKPDTRFGVELVDLTDIFRESQFKVFRSIADGGGVIKAINARGAATLLSKEQLKKWEEWVKTELGAKGLAYIRPQGRRMGIAHRQILLRAGKSRPRPAHGVPGGRRSFLRRG